MIYRNFKDLQLSLLGFGTMRLPMKDGEIDEEQTLEMVDYALKHGVNYFDTAYGYIEGRSEIMIGKALKNYPRESFYLATKFPGHQISETHYPAEIFENQLKKCQVDYFDFYLLHNVYEESIKVYDDPKWGIMDYFIEQKKRGKIKHLGFSSHGRLPNLKEFLDKYGEHLEFCQIQLNYLDWTLQKAKEKYELLEKYNIPVWVMEPVRGGRLAKLSEPMENKLREISPDRSTASWGFRWLMGLSNIRMILSGMSDMQQMTDNINTFSSEDLLTKEESDMLLDFAEGIKNNVPCTACRYCCDGCPKGLDIPSLLSLYNDARFQPSVTISMTMESMEPEKLPSACIACERCSHICPQKIDVPKHLKAFAEMLPSLPSWAQICKEREEANKKLANN